MKKLTAEKCCQLLDSLNSNGMSILEGYYVEALEIALPILEQQERGEDCGESLKHFGYLFVNSDGGVVYSPSGFCMKGFTCAGKIYGDVNLQHERDDDWIRWDGVIDACAEPVDGFIHVKFRDGIECKDYAHRYFWNHDGSSSDIIAYRIIPDQPTNQNGEQ